VIGFKTDGLLDVAHIVLHDVIWKRARKGFPLEEMNAQAKGSHLTGRLD